ncbi:hypothetical protein [Roseibium album]|uniref:hypothetical protein n=1 Tax=Roseibium album TaxID=311410 RepID=UPI00248FF360|nr:hypothetical protein [Roseibium album]
MRFVVLIAVGLLLAGCQTKSIEERLNTWIGATESEVLDQKGPPDRSYSSGGKKYLTWIGTPSAYTYGGTTSFYRCDLTFTFTRGKVTNWRTKGC